MGASRRHARWTMRSQTSKNTMVLDSCVPGPPGELDSRADARTGIYQGRRPLPDPEAEASMMLASGLLQRSRVQRDAQQVLHILDRSMLLHRKSCQLGMLMRLSCTPSKPSAFTLTAALLLDAGHCSPAQCSRPVLSGRKAHWSSPPVGCPARRRACTRRSMRCRLLQ